MATGASTDGPENDAPAVELSGLTKYYGDIRGVEDLSLVIEEGEIFGLLGPNGAGKSTAIRTLLGFLAPTSGTASLLGSPVTDRRARLAVMSEVGYLSGDVAFYDGVRGRHLLDYLERLRGGERRAELEARFPAPFDRRIETYSRGNRQKLGLVQTFMHDPSLVVMDEPTAGLDPLMQNAFYEFLDAERERGVTVIFSSHVLSEVRRVCDRVAVIREGRLVTVESIEDLLDKGGKVVTVDLAESPPAEVFAIDGVTKAERVEEATTNRYRLLVTENYDGLLDCLSAFQVEDLEVREASLDDVFLHFYADEEEDTGAVGAEDADADVTPPRGSLADVPSTDGEVSTTDGATSATDGDSRSNVDPGDGGDTHA